MRPSLYLRAGVSLIVAGLILLAVNVGFSAESSPVGKWRSIDDNTGKERSIIVITEENGELKGTVEKIFTQPGDDPTHICKLCNGDRKDKPIVGMNIMWGLKKYDDTWSGGEILDPKNGKTYKCKLSLEDGGKKLKVRGYIGISLIGRTQTWHREE